MKSLYDHCMETGSDLLSQWHSERNGDLLPSGITPGSNLNVWWICPRGHEYQALVKDRVHRNSGCPYCMGRKVLPGFNDLASQFPEIAAQWHPTLNDELTPQMVTPGSKKRVWWQCAEGHEWQAAVKDRTAGTGCPECVCRGKKPTRESKAVLPGINDLASQAPDIAAQWHPTLNGELTPDSVAAQTNRKVWWLCDKGHAYQAMVAVRVRRGSGCGCPSCAERKDFTVLASSHPDVAAQWHPTLNGDLTPEMVRTGSNKMVWWQCDLGHVWKAVVYSRTSKKPCGCPVCAGKVKLSKSED